MVVWVGRDIRARIACNMFTQAPWLYLNAITD